MGINFYIGKTNRSFGFSYSGFSFFRKALARAAGIDIKLLVGYSPNSTAINLDPINILLNQYDCEATLTTKECTQLKNRLKELNPNFQSDGMTGTDAEWYNKQFDEFKAILEIAVKQRKKVSWR